MEDKTQKYNRQVIVIVFLLCLPLLEDTRKVKVLSLPETMKEKSTFRAKALRWELVVGGRGKPRVFL